MQPPEQTTGQFSPDGYWMWNGAQWVPNPYRPVAAPAPTVPYESPGSRAGIAAILIYSSIAGIVLLTVANVAIDLTPNASDNLTVSALALVAFLVWLGTLVGAIVFFCMWLHRVIRNMPSLGAPDPRWSPARAVVYCFIPFVFWVHPLWSVLDAWRGADTSRRWLDRGTRRTLRAPGLFVAWWASWLIGNYTSNIGARYNGSPGAVLDVIGSVGQIIAAVLVVMVIREVTARQERKNELITSGQLI